MSEKIEFELTAKDSFSGVAKAALDRAAADARAASQAQERATGVDRTYALQTTTPQSRLPPAGSREAHDRQYRAGVLAAEHERQVSAARRARNDAIIAGTKTYDLVPQRDRNASPFIPAGDRGDALDLKALRGGRDPGESRVRDIIAEFMSQRKQEAQTYRATEEAAKRMGLAFNKTTGEIGGGGHNFSERTESVLSAVMGRGRAQRVLRSVSESPVGRVGMIGGAALAAIDVGARAVRAVGEAGGEQAQMKYSGGYDANDRYEAVMGHIPIAGQVIGAKRAIIDWMDARRNQVDEQRVANKEAWSAKLDRSRETYTGLNEGFIAARREQISSGNSLRLTSQRGAADEIRGDTGALAGAAAERNAAVVAAGLAKKNAIEDIDREQQAARQTMTFQDQENAKKGFDDRRLAATMAYNSSAAEAERAYAKTSIDIERGRTDRLTAMRDEFAISSQAAREQLGSTLLRIQGRFSEAEDADIRQSYAQKKQQMDADFKAQMKDEDITSDLYNEKLFDKYKTEKDLDKQQAADLASAQQNRDRAELRRVQDHQQEISDSHAAAAESRLQSVGRGADAQKLRANQTYEDELKRIKDRQEDLDIHFGGDKAKHQAEAEESARAAGETRDATIDAIMNQRGPQINRGGAGSEQALTGGVASAFDLAIPRASDTALAAKAVDALKVTTTEQNARIEALLGQILQRLIPAA